MAENERRNLELEFLKQLGGGHSRCLLPTLSAAFKCARIEARALVRDDEPEVARVEGTLEVTHKNGHSFRERKREDEEETILPEISEDGCRAHEDQRRCR